MIVNQLMMVLRAYSLVHALVLCTSDCCTGADYTADSILSHRTYEDILFIQVCNHQAPLHCSTVQGKKHALFLNVVVQNRLTASSAIAFTRMTIHSFCRCAITRHCSTVQGTKHALLFSVAV